MQLEYRDVDTLKQVRDVQRRAADLHMMCPPFARLDWEISECDEIIKRSFGKSNSFTRNMYSVYRNLILNDVGSDTNYNAGGRGIKITSGTAYEVRGIVYPNTLRYADEVLAIGNTSQGLVVGSGDAAESFEDYKLATQIAHGSAAAQLMYQAQNPSMATYDANAKTWYVERARNFINASGGSVTIKEIGEFFGFSVNASTRTLCTLRDVLETPIVLSSGQSVVIKYTIEMAFPA